MEVRIRGTEEFIKQSIPILSSMMEAKYITEGYAPFTPGDGLAGVVRRTKKGTIIMDDLTRLESSQ